MTIFCDNDKCKFNFQYSMVNANGCNKPGIDVENGKCISFRKKKIRRNNGYEKLWIKK